MKKTIISILSVCCITAAFTSCGDMFNESAGNSSVAEVTTTTAITTTTKPVIQMTTTVTTTNNSAEVTIPVTESTTTDKVKVTESVTTPVKSLISDEKINSYRNGDGVKYKDANEKICANLTKDSDGYHLAISNGTDYTAQYAQNFVTFDDFGDVITSVTDADGSQFESDIYTIHGCSECICLDAMDQAGTRTYEYRLYPVDNCPDDTSPNKNLTEFSSTLDNYNWKDRILNQKTPDFLNDEQKKIFANAEYLMQNFYLTANFGNGNGYTIKDNIRYYETGMQYESFVNYCESTFTPQFSSDVLNQRQCFVNVRGELYESDGARGGNSRYFSRSFKLDSQNDKEIKFKLIAHCVDADILTEEDYNSLPSEKKFDKEYTFTMVKTPDGWRFSEFNYWL